MHWADKHILSCTLLCSSSPCKTEILGIAPAFSHDLLRSYTHHLWNQLLIFVRDGICFAPFAPLLPVAVGGALCCCTCRIWIAWCRGVQSEQGEPLGYLSVVINLVSSGSCKMMMVMILCFHTGSLTQNMSHGRNSYLITTANLGKHFCLFVIKYSV